MPLHDVRADAASAPSCSGRRRDLAAALLLGLIALLIYNANLRSITAVDTYAARYLPLSILRHGSLLLDPLAETVAQGRALPTIHGKPDSAFWVVLGRQGHYVSLYPVALPLLIAPLYLPAYLQLEADGWDPPRVEQLARIMEKLAASLIAAASVALLYRLLRRRAGPGLAAALALLYAFGTTTWAISSQALWQHGFAQLLVVAILLLLTGPPGGLRVLAAGLLCGLLAAHRQPDALLAAGLGLYGLWWAGRRAPLLVIAALLPVGLTVYYNLVYVGHVGGSYALLARPGHIVGAPLEGLAGLLFSPGRGLFVYSPFLLALPCLLPLALRERRWRWLTLAAGAGVLAQLLLYALADWRQGASYGPRWLTDLLPILFWMLPPVVTALGLAGRLLFALAGAAAVAIQAIGAFWYSPSVDGPLFAAADPAQPRAPFWEPRNASFLAALRQPPPARDLLLRVQGTVDDVRIVEEIVPGGPAGDRLRRRLVIAGWVLADGRTPVGVTAMLGGAAVGASNDFFTRPDVVRALGSDSPAGWRIEIPAEALSAGEQTVTILVGSGRGAEPWLLGKRAFTLPGDDEAAVAWRLLELAAARASAVLTERQQPDGYWLTAHTRGRAFEQPRPEMNTYLNAILLDLAGPVADRVGLAQPLARARAFLTRQIEADGLVRYHGLPDAPTMGVLGCAITPDTDDTALAWRLAPAADRGRLAQALAIIGQYRRADGLYRTWLAPRERYRCIDPGRDPNPADIGIQQNLLLLLAREDPVAAGELCAALAPRTDDGTLWVYYQVAPLMVALRQPDLAAAGCPLELPAARLRTPVPGQEIWMQLAATLNRMRQGVGTAADLAQAQALLRRIAAGDFALLAATPPLFYHNDLTASVSRYYWSPELGYALWLRLYAEAGALRAALGCDVAGTGEECKAE